MYFGSGVVLVSWDAMYINLKFHEEKNVSRFCLVCYMLCLVKLFFMYD